MKGVVHPEAWVRVREEDGFPVESKSPLPALASDSLQAGTGRGRGLSGTWPRGSQPPPTPSPQNSGIHVSLASGTVLIPHGGHM